MDSLLAWLAAMALLAMVMLWLVFFPDARAALGAHIRRALGAAGGRVGRAAQHVGGNLHSNSQQAGAGVNHLWQRLTQHRWLVLIIVIALVTPAVLILSLRHKVILQGYSTNVSIDQDTADLITSLLQGEHLVPPPPLPPAVFLTKEVEREAPHLHLGSANRNWNLLNPQFRQRLLAVFKIMQDRYGYQMVMIEGYRSPQRQAQLASEGADVTHAGAGQSYHQYGLAADCAFYHNGKLVISDKSAWAKRGYTLYGEVAEAAGMVWGGSWKSLRDLGHVELHIPGLGPHAHR